MTEFVTVTGKVMYAKVFEHNRDMVGYEDVYVDCNGAYTIDVILDDVQFEKLQQSGSKLQGTETEDGFRKVKFKRKHETKNKDGEIIEAFSGPPQVVDFDGVDWDVNTLIGNDSECEVAITVAPDKKRKSTVYTRLEGVKVLDLVKFNGEGDGQRELPF